MPSKIAFSKTKSRPSRSTARTSMKAVTGMGILDFSRGIGMTQKPLVDTHLSIALNCVERKCSSITLSSTLNDVPIRIAAKFAVRKVKEASLTVTTAKSP